MSYGWFGFWVQSLVLLFRVPLGIIIVPVRLAVAGASAAGRGAASSGALAGALTPKALGPAVLGIIALTAVVNVIQFVAAHPWLLAPVALLALYGFVRLARKRPLLTSWIVWLSFLVGSAAFQQGTTAWAVYQVPYTIVLFGAPALTVAALIRKARRP
jgi:hypothetical protein